MNNIKGNNGVKGGTRGGKHTPETFLLRFWARVDRKGPDECWPWTGSNNGAEGRGKVHMGYKGDYKLKKRIQAYAYVVSWQIANGAVPTEMCVCHKCDNPRCVNPAHLFLAKQVDNIQDMMAKGRGDGFGHKKEAQSGLPRANRRRGERVGQQEAAA